MTLQVRRIRLSLISLWLLTAIPYVDAVRAQETTGTIFGTVRDQAGAMVPDAKVFITNVDTRQAREAVPNRLGQYTIALPVGKYEIRFLLPDSQPFIVSEVSLHVNDRWQIDGDLTIGLVETLNVTATRSVQRTASVQGLIPQVAIKELPIRDRTLVQFVTLVPGVSSDLREDRCFCDQGNLDISINGARRSAVNWLVDGASNVNTWTNSTLVTTPSLEAIQEINVITSTFSAEWSRNGGGVVNAVTKSGGQRFSGGAYDFLRNDGLNANSFFRNMDPNPSINGNPRRLRYNNFGYTLGGPALPHRRRLFFFFSEEFRRSSRDERLLSAPVPDPGWLTDSASPNYVPPEARDPNAVKLLALWPTPNVPGTNRYQELVTTRLDTRQEFGRADASVGANWAVTGRYLRDRVDSRGEGNAADNPAPDHRYLAGHLAVVEARRAGGRLLYEASYQLSLHTQSRREPEYTKADLGIAVPELFPENAANLVPQLWLSGVSTVGGAQPRPREYRNHTLTSALTVQHGAHTVKAGGLFAVEHMNSNLISEKTQGVFSFGPGGGFTAFQNFLRGNADGKCGERCIYSETDVDVINRFRTRRYEAYVQDTWRIHPNVTFDAGLRYAFYPPLVDDNNMLFTFSPEAYDPAKAPAFANIFPQGSYLIVGTGSLINGLRTAGRDSPFGRALYPADTNNLQPRLGIAWDPGGSGRMVLRSGYGVYFDQTQFEMFSDGNQLSTFDPFRTDAIVTNALLSNPGGGPSVPQVLPKPRNLLHPQSPVETPKTVATSEQLVAPRWQHWNVGVQRQLYRGGAIDAGYVASRGDHLLRYVDINRPRPTDLLVPGATVNKVRPFPGYGEIAVRESTARSQYHGFATSLRHERSGLWATVNYTFSRNKADATYDNSSIDDPQNPLQKDAEFAAALTDRTHIFNASYVYQLPFARAATAGWRKALLGGWQLSGITRIESGPAARVQVTKCGYPGGACFPGELRPNQVADPAAGDQEGLLWFDPAAFTLPAAGEYGTAPVAPFRLPGRHQWDFAISKVVGLGGKRLQFRADLINAFNHTQFLDVNTSCVGTATCGSSFGKATSTRPPREIQLGVRLDW